MHGENQCIGSSVLGPQEAGRTATTTGRALNQGPDERAARGRRAFRAAGAAAQEQRERAKGGHCLKAARGRQGTSADLQQDVLTPWTRHTAPHTSARRKYNDSDCCGGLEAVGRLLALDSRCFQKLRQIPTKSVFLALDSRSFLKLRWIPTKKSVCAGFQYCCAGLLFSHTISQSIDRAPIPRGSGYAGYALVIGSGYRPSGRKRPFGSGSHPPWPGH